MIEFQRLDASGNEIWRSALANAEQLESDGVSVRRIAAVTGQVLWRAGRAQ